MKKNKKYLVIPDFAVQYESDNMTVKSIDMFFGTSPEFDEEMDAVGWLMETDYPSDLYVKEGDVIKLRFPKSKSTKKKR